MATRPRTLLIAAGVTIALILIAVLAIPLFLDADSFRSRIEQELSASLGRKVSLGKLDLSIWSGSLVATKATLADDPAFSKEPILQAALVKINVELIPLIFSHQIHISGFTINQPTINLIRHADGTWNYSTIGTTQPKQPGKESTSSIMGVTISHVTITNGKLTVSTEPTSGAPATPRRTYDQVNIEAKNFTFSKPFPFTLTAHLPAEGTVSLAGNVGPLNEKDASLTPFGAKLEVKHLDPVAAGFLEPSSGISGTIDAINVESTWNGQQLHLASLIIDTPKLTIVRKTTPAAAKPVTPNSNDMLSTLTADRLQVKNGTLTLNTPGEPKPAVYQQLNAEITNFSPVASSPFKLGARISGGGSLTADGTAGPLNQQFPAATPLNTHATLNNIDLASSGIIAANAGISGLANADIKAVSDGKNLNANISANVQNLRLAANGSPSTKPVSLQVSVAQSMQSLAGQIQNAVVTVGRANVNITGTYQTTGPTTALNLKINSNSVPIDEIEAFLPSVGVHLPSGSRLQGGTLTTNLAVTGTTAAPIISGPVQLNNTNLTGFDLGSKLSAVTALTGAKTGSATAIRSLKANINVAGGNVRTDNLAIDVPALGTATGAGTVAASGALNYNVLLKLTGIVGTGKPGSAPGVGGIAGQLMGMIPNSGAAGAVGGFTTSALRNGIPVAIGGTTTNPTFTPNLSGAVMSGASSLNGSTNAPSKGKQSSTDALTNTLGGLLNKHK